MASCDFIWQCVKSQVQYFTRKDMLERAGGSPFPTLQKALRIDGDGDPDAPPRRGRATLSSAPKALGNRGGLRGELLFFRFEFLQRAFAGRRSRSPSRSQPPCRLALAAALRRGRDRFLRDKTRKPGRAPLSPGVGATVR